MPYLQVRDLVTVVIPLREVVLVEKVDNAASGELGTDSLVVTTKGKVHDLLIIHVALSHLNFTFGAEKLFFYLKDIMYNLFTVH